MEFNQQIHAHRAPMPDEEPLPGEVPPSENDPIPNPDPVVREPGEAPPPQVAGDASCGIA